jgi:hypothetical protein
MVSGYFDGKKLRKKKEVEDNFCNIFCAYFIFQRNFVWVLRGLCCLLGYKAFYSALGGVYINRRPIGLNRQKENPDE